MPSGNVSTVENAFQAGKVFQNGGPYQDLLAKTPREAKSDPRLTTSGPLVGFSLEGEHWPTQPQTAFYDWLYVAALRQTPTLAAQLSGFGGFSDIEFNPKRSINCQAHAAALFVALSVRGELEAATKDRETFIRRLTLHSTNHGAQGRFF